ARWMRGRLAGGCLARRGLAGLGGSVLAGGGFLARCAAWLLLLLLADQIVVEDELVAVGDEQVGGGILYAAADHTLVVLAELAYQRGEVGVAADDHKGVYVRLGVAQVERIHDHADVCRVLAGD